MSNSNEICVYGGDSATLLLEVVDEKDEVVDLTGAFIAFTVKAFIDDTEHLTRKTTDDPAEIEITAPKAGEAKIKLTGLETENEDCKDYLYDVRVELSDGFRQTVIEPTLFRIKRAVGTY